MADRAYVVATQIGDWATMIGSGNGGAVSVNGIILHDDETTSPTGGTSNFHVGDDQGDILREIAAMLRSAVSNPTLEVTVLGLGTVHG